MAREHAGFKWCRWIFWDGDDNNDATIISQTPRARCYSSRGTEWEDKIFAMWHNEGKTARPTIKPDAADDDKARTMLPNDSDFSDGDVGPAPT